MSKKNKPREALVDELVAETAGPTPPRDEALEVLEKSLAEMRSDGVQTIPYVPYSVQRCPRACVDGMTYEYPSGPPEKIVHQQRVTCPVCKGRQFVKVNVDSLEVLS